MGAVYRAVDVMLDREVALKAIRPELARDRDAVERFRGEARTLARLNHPAIATIYNFFEHEGDFFLAMEFLRGETLGDLLRKKGALPWKEAVALLASALEGIEQAHALGIVHRDLKPDNLMLTGAGTLKVMDFGIARVAGGSRRLTQTGYMVGTLRYMSPEQIRDEPVDHRTDLYALGAVLFEMLTGRVPFDGGSDYTVLRAQVEEPPPPPRDAVPDLPDWLEHAVLRALAKRPADRFQTVGELRRLLQLRGDLRPAGRTTRQLTLEEAPTVVAGARSGHAAGQPPPPAPPAGVEVRREAAVALPFPPSLAPRGGRPGAAENPLPASASWPAWPRRLPSRGAVSAAALQEREAVEPNRVIPPPEPLRPASPPPPGPASETSWSATPSAFESFTVWLADTFADQRPQAGGDQASQGAGGDRRRFSEGSEWRERGEWRKWWDWRHAAIAAVVMLMLAGAIVVSRAASDLRLAEPTLESLRRRAAAASHRATAVAPAPGSERPAAAGTPGGAARAEVPAQPTGPPAGGGTAPLAPAGGAHPLAPGGGAAPPAAAGAAGRLAPPPSGAVGSPRGGAGAPAPPLQWPAPPRAGIAGVIADRGAQPAPENGAPLDGTSPLVVREGPRRPGERPAAVAQGPSWLDGRSGAAPLDPTGAVSEPGAPGLGRAAAAAPEAPRGPLPKAELRRLGQELERESGSLRALYGAYLERQGGSSEGRQRRLARLSQELSDFGRSVERFNQPLRGGFFTRFKRRLHLAPPPAVDRGDMASRAQELAASGSRVDRLLAELRPNRQLRHLWSETRANWRRAANLCLDR